MIYLIIVKSRSLDFDYSPLYDKIKSIGDYIQAMDCLWFVYTKELINVSEVVKDLKNYIGESDLLFMSELSSNAKKDGRLLKTTWDFIREKEKLIENEDR